MEEHPRGWEGRIVAGTIDFSTGDWVDTNSDDVPDAPARSVYVNLSIGAYNAYSDPNGAGYSNIASTGSATTVTGTANGDNLTGGSDSDRLDGADGDDRLYSFNGNDVLNGGKGNDYLVGSRDTDGGHDVLNGGDGDDTIDGVVGNDVISGGAGDDTISYHRDGGVSTAMIDAGEGMTRSFWLTMPMPAPLTAVPAWIYFKSTETFHN
jgi:Ca2+-binding RTX toxin-like protein